MIIINQLLWSLLANCWLILIHRCMIILLRFLISPKEGSNILSIYIGLFRDIVGEDIQNI